MAKTRGGLGRGLNSLLGGALSEAAPAEVSTAKERIVVESDQMKKTQPRPETPVNTSQVDASENMFPNHEDHITIKSVTAREVMEPSPDEKSSGAEQTDISDPALSETPVDEVSIDLVQPNPDQPRTNFKKEDLEELADSIRANGLLQPILVRAADDGTYQIIAGERRWQACRSIGLPKMPIRVKEADDDKAIELALVENIQRSDLNPIEEAYGYRRMMERGNMTQSEVAQAVSKGRSTVANALRLLELPEDAQKLLFEEKITAGHARAILSIPTKEGRRKLTRKLMEQKLSVRETESIARLLSGKNDGAPVPRTPTPRSFKTVARALRNTLNTNVRVKTVKGKNKIEIEFNDEEDLRRLFNELTGARLG